MRAVITFVLLLSFTSVASAQSTFISGSLIGEIARFGYIEPQPLPFAANLDDRYDDEAIGFALAIERALGERWGVALEFVKPGTMAREDSYEFPVSIAIFPPIPPVTISREVEHDRFSWNTVAWVSQPAGDRLEFAFTGGVAFTRTRLEQEFFAIVPALVQLVPGFLPPRSTESVEYSVEPVVGMDARIRFGERLSVVPGVRLQSGGLAGRRGFLLRPGVGVRFGF